MTDTFLPMHRFIGTSNQCAFGNGPYSTTHNLCPHPNTHPIHNEALALMSLDESVRRVLGGECSR